MAFTNPYNKGRELVIWVKHWEQKSKNSENLLELLQMILPNLENDDEVFDFFKGASVEFRSNPLLVEKISDRIYNTAAEQVWETFKDQMKYTLRNVLSMN